MFVQQPFDTFLGISYEKHSDTELDVHLPIQPLFINSAGAVHGGIISSLADIAMCNLLSADDTGTQQAVTVDLQVSFVKAARGESLRAHACMTKKGKTIVHTDCRIYSDSGELVATARAVLFRTGE